MLFVLVVGGLSLIYVICACCRRTQDLFMLFVLVVGGLRTYLCYLCWL